MCTGLLCIAPDKATLRRLFTMAGDDARAGSGRMVGGNSRRAWRHEPSRRGPDRLAAASGEWPIPARYGRGARRHQSPRSTTITRFDSHSRSTSWTHRARDHSRQGQLAPDLLRPVGSGTPWRVHRPCRHATLPGYVPSGHCPRVRNVVMPTEPVRFVSLRPRVSLSGGCRRPHPFWV